MDSCCVSGDQGKDGVSRSNSTGSVPRLVAMLLWLLSDRRILGLRVDELPPSESCWPDTPPCMDQDPAAAPDPVRAPAGGAEGVSGPQRLGSGSGSPYLGQGQGQGHPTWAYCCLRGPDRRRTQHRAGPRLHRTQSHDHRQTRAFVHFRTHRSIKSAQKPENDPTLAHVLGVGLNVMNTL